MRHQEKHRQRYAVRVAMDGFTLLELVLILTVVGILAISVAPRFFDSSAFDAQGFSDQLKSTIRFAQKIAIAQRRLVCVNLGTSTPATVTLTIANTNAAVACATALNVLPGQTNTITAPTGVTLTATQTTFNFNGLGVPSVSTVITIPSVTNPITVEAGTGYVHQ